LTLTTAALAVVVAGSPVAVAAASPTGHAGGPGDGSGHGHGPKDVAVQLLAMNDFHGRISNTTGRDSQLLTAPGADGVYGSNDDVKTLVGGSANVATTVKSLQTSFDGSTQGPHTSLFVGAGDLISASPFESSVFKDEPTIEVLNAMGLDVSGVGNHEFDRGTAELRRISAATDGTYTDDVTACEDVQAEVDGCFTDSTGQPFAGTDFPYLAANVISKKTGQPMLPPYQLFDVGGGQQIALVGVVTDTTPTIVSPGGIADVQFIDEADAVNHWTHELKKQGIRSIGVLLHEGGEAGLAMPPTPAYDGCTELTGPIVDLNERMDKQVDFIVSAHTHQAYNCLLPVRGSQPRLVTQAGYYGRLVTDIRLTIDTRTGDVDRSATYAARNVPVTRTAPDPTVQSIVDYWNGRASEAGDELVGVVNGDMNRVPGDESSLGTFAANAQLAAVQQEQFGNPVVAFMNPGGLRANLAGGDVTYRELFDVQPFGNTVNTTTLTGAQIKQVLEQQFGNGSRTATFILSTSDGFSYQYDPSRAAGDRVFACSITIGKTIVDPLASYRVAGNSFLLGGGDSFDAFKLGTNPTTGPVDVDTAVSYLAANTPLTPPAGNHAVVTSTPSC
jgi:5'-nucleotidase